ncbi:hypothetical protein Goarm_020615, partial [Gossypium armourianum]|nr:hypothetical protein [Gossypium armourianum]
EIRFRVDSDDVLRVFSSIFSECPLRSSSNWGEFNLNNFEDGVLSSAFMVGLLVASPIFASLSKSVNPFRLIGVGLSVWTLATAGCGFSFNFWSITMCRMLVGVGEASFISLAAPFIDDNAPIAQRQIGDIPARSLPVLIWVFAFVLSILVSSKLLVRFHIKIMWPKGTFSLSQMLRNSGLSENCHDREGCKKDFQLLMLKKDKLIVLKTAWLAIFYMCIPTGYALGYVYGGLVGTYLNWRFAFWVEAILMLPFAVLGFVMKPLNLKGFAPAESKQALISEETDVQEVQDLLLYVLNSFIIPGEDTDALNDSAKPTKEKFSHMFSKMKCTCIDLNQFSRFIKDMKALLVDKVYVVNVLGAYSYWGPKAGYKIYNMSDADLIFGGITIVCGILGTLAGGYVLDLMKSTIPNAFKNMYAFLAFFSVGELLVFAIQGPVNYICLHCVNPSLRPLSMAISTVSIHIFGDVPSSPLVGVLQDAINNWRETSLILTSILFPAAGIWFTGIFLHSVDRFNEDSEGQVTEVDRSNAAPLLEPR